MKTCNPLISVIVVVIAGSIWLNVPVYGQAAGPAPSQPAVATSQPPSDKDLALLDAAFAGDLDAVTGLLAQGARVDVRDPNGLTPLILASYGGHVEIVKLLLSKGADPATKDEHGQTALVHATQKGHNQVIALLEIKPDIKLMGGTLVPKALPATSYSTSGVIKTTYFDITYKSATEKKAADALALYVGAAYSAAKSVIGYDNKLWTQSGSTLYQSSQITKINVSFYNNPSDGFSAWASGSSSITFNLAAYPTFDGKKMGSTLAHETTHILFNTNARTAYWNRSTNMGYYQDFIHEALAYYAGNVAYQYGGYTQSYIKQQLQSYTKQTYGSTTTFMSWWGAGKVYREASSGQRGFDKTFWTAWWTFNAAGYFLAYGKSSKTKSLVDAFRNSSGLRSSDYNTARGAYEQAFKTAYGKFANAGLIYDATGKSTSYLMGDYYNMFLK